MPDLESMSRDELVALVREQAGRIAEQDRAQLAGRRKGRQPGGTGSAPARHDAAERANRFPEHRVRTPQFDELDRKILVALIANARTSFAEIGAAIGLSATAVKRRADRLRERDVITGFTATVRPDALGWRTEAYVEVYCDSAAPPRRLAEVARGYPEIVAAMTVTGGADALLHVRATDVAHFEEVLERIRAEPFVRKTLSYLVLSHLLPNSPEAAARERAPGDAANLR